MNKPVPAPFKRLRHAGKLVTGEPATDGAGVRLNRVMGARQLNMLDPFLLLDEFRSDDKSDYIAGFPDHPHRGFETVTYMLAGRIRHRDNAGHEGVVVAGGIQWMTAGSGIVHSEMPEQEDGLMWGFQLWINLPARDKGQPPAYQEFRAQDIPVENADGVRIHVIAGQTSRGTSGPVTGKSTQPLFLDLEFNDDCEFSESLAAETHAFIYVYQGSVHVITDDREAREVSRGTLAVLMDGDSVRLSADSGARCLLLAAKPINEPVARGGPFVMNTRAEVMQAFDDYNSGRFGADNAG